MKTAGSSINVAVKFHFFDMTQLTWFFSICLIIKTGISSNIKLRKFYPNIPSFSGLRLLDFKNVDKYPANSPAKAPKSSL